MSEDSKPQGRPATEAELRLRQLAAQVEEAELKAQRARREEAHAPEETELKIRQLRAQAEKAEIDRDNARREHDKALADAQEVLTYTFYDVVNADTVKAALGELGKWSRRFPGKPLKIILNSPGGSVIAGLALYDYIRQLSKSGHHVTVVALGTAASMGGILLQAGDKRVVGEHAMVLIHEVSSGTTGKVSAMEEDIRFSGRLWDKLAEILAKHSKLSVRQIKNRAKKVDWWLDANEAVKLGFADEIL